MRAGREGAVLWVVLGCGAPEPSDAAPRSGVEVPPPAATPSSAEPSATATAAVAPEIAEGLVVHVRRELLEGPAGLKVSLEAGRLAAGQEAQRQLFALEAALRERVQAGEAPRLRIVMRAESAFHTIFELMRSAERAGVEDFELSLDGADGLALPVGLPDVLRSAAEPGSETDLAPVLSMELDERGLSLSVAGRSELTPQAFAEGELSALRGAAESRIRDNPGMHRLVLSARAELPMQRIVAAIEALQGRACLSGEPSACVVDEVELLGGGAHIYDPARHGVLAALAHAQDTWVGFENPAVAESFGVGGLGLVGTGTSDARYGYPGQPSASLGTIGTTGTIGYGAGTPQGTVSYPAGVKPKVIPRKPEVKGRLAPEVVRRIVRRHINELRHCYAQRLAEHPDLAGEVVIAFVVGTDGRVASAQVASSTLSDAQVGSCLVVAHRRWAFPPPEGGIAMVRYPYVFRPDAD